MPGMDHLGVSLRRAALPDKCVGVGEVDKDGRFLAINDAVGQLLGRPEDQIIGHPFLTFVHPDSQPTSMAEYFEAIAATAAGVRSGSAILRFLTGEDDSIWLDVSWSVTEPGDAGTPRCFIYLAEHRVRQETTDDAGQAVHDDRLRIARDLHDHVIGQLFAAGLAVQASIESAGSHVAHRLSEAVELIDRAIGEIRIRVFDLRGRPTQQGSPTGRLRDVVDEIEPLLGFRPHLLVRGPIDDIGEEILEDLVACLREALTNVVRHARATQVGARVQITDTYVTLTVSDNGVGYQPKQRGRGVLNLAARARAQGGRFAISRPSRGGTRLRWHVPMTPRTTAAMTPPVPPPMTPPKT